MTLLLASPSDRFPAPPTTSIAHGVTRPSMGQLTKPSWYRAEVVTGIDDGARAAADAAVERAWMDGHETALQQAWSQFGALVFTYCSRAIADQEHAADAVQETFVSAWKSRDRFDSAKGSLAAWLTGIARYRVLDAYRAAPRIPTPGLDEHAVEQADPAPSPHDALGDRLLVAHALETLSPRARRVVELAFYSELSQSEIAIELDLPLGTVKSDMRRALQRLRTHLEGGDLP